MYVGRVPAPKHSVIRKAQLRNRPPGDRAWVKELEAVMDRMGLDQPALGGLLGAAQQTVSYWLSGHPPKQPETQFDMERRLELPPGTLSRHLGFVPAPPEE